MNYNNYCNPVQLTSFDGCRYSSSLI